VYGISVLTHMGPDLARDWFGEIRRVLTDDGMFFSTQGSAYLDRLTPSDRQMFEAGEPVLHFCGTPGNNTCSCYQPRVWVETATASAGLEVVDVVESGLQPEHNRPMAQDRYLVRAA